MMPDELHSGSDEEDTFFSSTCPSLKRTVDDIKPISAKEIDGLWSVITSYTVLIQSC